MGISPQRHCKHTTTGIFHWINSCCRGWDILFFHPMYHSSTKNTYIMEDDVYMMTEEPIYDHDISTPLNNFSQRFPFEAEMQTMWKDMGYTKVSVCTCIILVHMQRIACYLMDMLSLQVRLGRVQFTPRIIPTKHKTATRWNDIWTFSCYGVFLRCCTGTLT